MPLIDRIETIEGLLDVEPTIDQLIRYLHLIKDDLKDDTELYEEINIESLRIRNQSVKVLSDLLQQYLGQIL